jgi:hypothetical protein
LFGNLPGHTTKSCLRCPAAVARPDATSAVAPKDTLYSRRRHGPAHCVHHGLRVHYGLRRHHDRPADLGRRAGQQAGRLSPTGPLKLGAASAPRPGVRHLSRAAHLPAGCPGTWYKPSPLARSAETWIGQPRRRTSGLTHQAAGVGLRHRAAARPRSGGPAGDYQRGAADRVVGRRPRLAAPSGPR